MRLRYGRGGELVEARGLSGHTFVPKPEDLRVEPPPDGELDVKEVADEPPPDKPPYFVPWGV